MSNPVKIYEFEVSRNRYPYLQDHKIGNNAIIPATLYLEALFSHASKKLDLPLLLKSIRYSRALSVNADECYQMKILIEENDKETNYQIILADEKTACASATVASLTTEKPARIDINTIINRCPERIERKAYYNNLARYNLNFGPRHQGLKFIQIGNEEAIAQIERLPENDDSEFFAHPSFLDTFTHVGLFTLTNLSPTQIYVTADQERIELYQPFPKLVWCHSTIVKRDKNEIFVDICIYTPEGDIIAKIVNYRLKIIEQFFLLPEQYLYYTLDWSENPPSNMNQASPPDKVIVIGDMSVVSGKIAKSIEHIEAGNPTEITNPEHTAIIFNASNEIQDIYQSNIDVLNNLLSLIQWLSNLHGRELHRLIVLCKDDLKYASLSGFCHVINQEAPNLHLQQIRVDDTSTISDCITDALSRPYEDQRIFYRHNEYLSFRLKPVYDDTSKQKPLLQDAAYLITGGLGGIGLAIANWLVKCGVKQVFLLHRSAISSAQQSSLDKLNEHSQIVTPIQCDITDKQNLAATINKIHQHPFPLKGIFHAAGTTKDNLIQKLSKEDIETVLKPKLLGTLNLHEVTKDIALDYFVLFSSVTSFLGTKGVANYAAANSFLNEFASFRASQGLAATSINWGPWSEGMLTKLGDKVKQSWEDQGFKILSGDEGTHCLSVAIHMNYPQIAIMPVDWIGLLSKYAAGNNCSVLNDIKNALGVHFSDSSINTTILPTLQSADADSREDILNEYLLDKIQKLTGSTQSDLDLSFTQFGIDSMAAIELSSQLERDFHIAIPQTVVYNYPNITNLTEYLISTKLAPLFNVEQKHTGTEPLNTKTDDISDEDLKKLLNDELDDLDNHK